MKTAQKTPGTTPTPKVDALIASVMAKHPGDSPKSLAVYFEAVHQELAPLARVLECENQRLRANYDQMVEKLGKMESLAYPGNSKREISPAVVLTMGAVGSRPICSIEKQPHDHFSPGIETRLAKVVNRIYDDWFAINNTAWVELEAINELAATDFEQRITSALIQNLTGLSQLVLRQAHLLLYLGEPGLMVEERILSLEQLAIHLSDLYRQQIPVSQLKGSLSNVLG